MSRRVPTYARDGCGAELSSFAFLPMAYRIMSCQRRVAEQNHRQRSQADRSRWQEQMAGAGAVQSPPSPAFVDWESLAVALPGPQGALPSARRALAWGVGPALVRGPCVR